MVTRSTGSGWLSSPSSHRLEGKASLLPNPLFCQSAQTTPNSLLINDRVFVSTSGILFRQSSPQGSSLSRHCSSLRDSLVRMWKLGLWRPPDLHSARPSVLGQAHVSIVSRHTPVHKIDKQRGPTVWHREVHPISCSKP